jgi:energy-coupling factor transporter transmembrane protein EcfT
MLKLELEMHTGSFAILGIIGILILLILGNRLLKIPTISSRRFAYSLAILFALLLFVLILVSRQISIALIIVAFILSSISYLIGYQVFHYFPSYNSSGGRKGRGHS